MNRTQRKHERNVRNNRLRKIYANNLAYLFHADGRMSLKRRSRVDLAFRSDLPAGSMMLWQIERPSLSLLVVLKKGSKIF